MNSRDKITAQLDALDQIDVAQLDPGEAAMLSAGLMLRGQIAAMLPAEPDQLDLLLWRGAVWALAQRSDDAEPLVVGVAVPEPEPEPEPVHVPPLPDAELPERGGVQ